MGSASLYSGNYAAVPTLGAPILKMGSSSAASIGGGVASENCAPAILVCSKEFCGHLFRQSSVLL